MSTKQPIYRYIVALILGLIVVLMPDMEQSLLPRVLLPAVICAVLGFAWPAASWRWGLWTAAPVLVFLLLSVIFSGHLDMFLDKDLPVAVLVLAAGCAGSFAGARYRLRKTAG